MSENQRYRKFNKIRFLSGIISLLWLCACGVKGKPLPPTDPTFIGRGQPYIFSAPEPDSEEEKKRKFLNEK